jgi:hypothetical protein
MSISAIESNKDEWHFKGIKKHHISMLPIYEKNRNESLEATLLKLNMEDIDENFSFFPRTTNLYKSDVELLEKLNEKIESSDAFSSSSVINESSDLGLSHKIVARVASKVNVTFDGIFLRVTEVITGDSFKKDKLAQNTGAPTMLWESINSFCEIVNTFDQDNPWIPNPHYVYYTIDEVKWDKIGLNRSGNAQVKLVLNDPKYLAFFSWGDATSGKEFDVYLGVEDTIHQMLAQDNFMDFELARYRNFFNNKINTLHQYQTSIVSDFGGIISSPWKIFDKNRKWHNVKETMKSIYQIKDQTEKGKLLCMTIKNIIDERIAFHNIPITEWILDQKPDPQEKMQKAIKHFFEIKIENGNYLIPDSPQKPKYSNESIQLNNKINYLNDVNKEMYERVRDLLVAYQTEFSLYAVWLAIIAVFIAIFSLNFDGVLSVFNWMRALVSNLF